MSKMKKKDNVKVNASGKINLFYMMLLFALLFALIASMGYYYGIYKPKNNIYAPGKIYSSPNAVYNNKNIYNSKNIYSNKNIYNKRIYPNNIYKTNETNLPQTPPSGNPNGSREGTLRGR